VVIAMSFKRCRLNALTLRSHMDLHASRANERIHRAHVLRTICTAGFVVRYAINDRQKAGALNASLDGTHITVLTLCG
jgi:hypothetical protein